MSMNEDQNKGMAVLVHTLEYISIAYTPCSMGLWIKCPRSRPECVMYPRTNWGTLLMALSPKSALFYLQNSSCVLGIFISKRNMGDSNVKWSIVLLITLLWFVIVHWSRLMYKSCNHQLKNTVWFAHKPWSPSYNALKKRVVNVTFTLESPILTSRFASGTKIRKFFHWWKNRPRRAFVAEANRDAIHGLVPILFFWGLQ